MLTRNVTAVVDARGGRAGRYLVVSAFNVVTSQIILFVANSIWGWSGGWANAFAASVVAVPAYLLSRNWVWAVEGKHSISREVVPFWSLALIGLLVSSALAQMADSSQGAGLWVNAASIAGYFIVWLAKFFLLNKLFGKSDRR